MVDGYQGVEGVELRMMMMRMMMLVVLEHRNSFYEKGSCSDAPPIEKLSPRGHNSRHFLSRYYSDRCKESYRKN